MVRAQVKQQAKGRKAGCWILGLLRNVFFWLALRTQDSKGKGKGSGKAKGKEDRNDDLTVVIKGPSSCHVSRNCVKDISFSFSVALCFLLDFSLGFATVHFPFFVSTKNPKRSKRL